MFVDHASVAPLAASVAPCSGTVADGTPRCLVLTEQIGPFADFLRPMKTMRPIALAHRPDLALQIVRRAPISIVFCSTALAAERAWQSTLQDVLQASRSNALTRPVPRGTGASWLWMVESPTPAAGSPAGIDPAPDLVAAAACLLQGDETQSLVDLRALKLVRRVLDVYRGYAGDHYGALLRAFLRTRPFARNTAAETVAHALAAGLAEEHKRGFFLTEVALILQ